MAISIGVFRSMEPFHIVPIQLKIFTPVGTAISIVVMVNTEFAMGPSPTVNIWWLHTAQLMMAMTMPEKTTTGYPNSGFRLNVGMISETTPIAGKIRMYTSGCPNSQNRCCHRMGSPPAAVLKKLASNCRSAVS